MRSNGILVFYHCHTNPGYAVGRHEIDFYNMACAFTGDLNKVHLGYTDLSSGMPSYIDETCHERVIEFDSMTSNIDKLLELYKYIADNNIDVAFGFDQPVRSNAYYYMRKAGIKLLVSYWGAPMSSINSGLKLLLKKIEVGFTRYKPDHFIFQSESMANTATLGRGICKNNISVIHNAVNTDVYKPNVNHNNYAHNLLRIPKDRKIIYYSGHMEERKGVHIIVKAADDLVRVRKRDDVHFIFLGNINGEEKKFEPLYINSKTENHITFCGYRHDIDQILPSCYLGVIASTGWDSFTMSSMEIASSGLPLIVSNLQGLTETIVDGVTGYYFPAGSSIDLANKIEAILDDVPLRNKMGLAGRKRVIERFSLEHHMHLLLSTMYRLYHKCVINRP